MGLVLPSLPSVRLVGLIRLVGLVGLLFSSLAAFADTPTLEVSVNRDRVYLGESLLLEVKVGGGGENPGTPDVSALQNCSAELLGSQSASRYSVVIVNGQVHKEGFSGRTFTYKLTPTVPGTLLTGPIKATIEGNTLTANGPAVTVTGITQQDIVSVAVSSSRDTVLVDEPFDITLAIRIRRLPGGFADADPIFPADAPHIEGPFLNAQEIQGLKGPDYQKVLNAHLIPRNQAGFSINNYTVQADMFDFSSMMNPQGVPARFKLDRKPTEENGKAYWEYTLTLPFSPLTEGSYTFGPVLFKGNVATAVNGQGQGQGTQIFAVGPAAIVRVVPPPEADRPDSYIGAIGSNLVVDAALDTQTCNVGDPLKLTLTISGAVQMRNISPPKLSLQTNLLDHFEVYDDTVQTVKQDGQRQYAYTFRPRHAGSFECPPIEVTYYDVATRRYHSVATPPIPLKVRQAAEITASQVIGGSTNQAIRLHHDEEAAMIPAGMRMDSSATETASLTGNPVRLALIAGTGPVFFAGIGLSLLLLQHLPAFKRNRRRRQAFPHARHELKSLASKGAGGNPHPLICSILRQYLADRFNAQSGSLTPKEAQSLLATQGIPDLIAGRFADLMQHHFNASFETSMPPATVNIAALESVLSDVERHLRDAPVKRFTPTTTALLLILLTPVLVSASTPAERAFIWDQACTEMTSAKTPKEFLAAATTCQKLVDLGIRNAPLFYNQGTALLLAEKPTEAIEVLLRAERYGGSTSDIRRNLAIAQARKDGLKTPEASWLRLVLAWHYGFDCATRATVAAGAFSALWVAATLSLAGFRRTGRTLMIVAALVFVLSGSSTLTTLQQESRIQRPVLEYAERPPA